MDCMSDTVSPPRSCPANIRSLRETKGKVLIVDDEYLIRFSMQTLMEREGCEVFAAETGQDALRLFGERKPDVVILDIRLPDTNGFVLLKMFKEIDPSAVVIMATGCADAQGRSEAMKMGALDYLEKPVSLEQLNAVMRAAKRPRVGPAALTHLYERWREKQAGTNSVIRR